MKNYKYLFLPLIFIVSSCYIYRPYAEAEVKEESKIINDGKSVASTLKSTKEKDAGRNDAEAKRKAWDEKVTQDKLEQERREKERLANSTGVEAKENTSKSTMGFTNAKGETAQDIRKKKTEKVNPSSSETLKTLKEKIQPNKYYRIAVEDKQYKIQADKWEGDTLVSHILRKPNKVLKFHENQIIEEALEERVFSKPYSDIFTVGAYVSAGAAVLLLLL